jgi:hypothetical protein
MTLVSLSVRVIAVSQDEGCPNGVVQTVPIEP